jgi:hypothetical protein
MDVEYIDKCQYEIQEQKKFRYGIPEYTDPFRALVLLRNTACSFLRGRYIQPPAERIRGSKVCLTIKSLVCM